MDERDSLDALPIETLRIAKEYLVDDKPTTFDECIVWARLKFQENFYNRIKQLLYTHPPDAVDSDGQPFWRPPKRPPEPIEFDPNDELHMRFIISAANLRASNFGIKGTLDVNYFRKVLSSVMVPKFVPKKIRLDGDEGNEKKDDDKMIIDDDEKEKLISILQKHKFLPGYR